MLKKKAFKRILITTVALFIVLFIYTFLLKDNNTLVYDDTYYINSEDKRSIYCLNKDDYVSKTSIYVDKELTLEEKVKSILETMTIENNKNSLLPSYFKPILPRNTKVENVILDEDILKVYFSKEFMDATSEQSNHMIESITYSLLEFDNVLGVEIYVDNKLLEYVPNSTKKLPTVLTKDYGINKVYNISNNKDITKVILYYLTKDNNEYYYIPVTKYLNNKDEKVEIIVDDLSSTYYKDISLISFLNVGVKLLDYDIQKDGISLVFNEKIYDDEESILNDEAINALMYSVFANYDVDKVDLIVNDKIIYQGNRNMFDLV